MATAPGVTVVAPRRPSLEARAPGRPERRDGGGRGDGLEGLSTDRLKLELLEESHMKDIVQLSVLEIKHKITELEAKLSADNEGSEWKTHYETQLELNDQLEKKIVSLEEKMEKNSWKSFRGRYNPVNQKTMNVKKGPVKKIARTNHLPKLTP